MRQRFQLYSYQDIKRFHGQPVLPAEQSLAGRSSTMRRCAQYSGLRLGRRPGSLDPERSVLAASSATDCPTRFGRQWRAQVTFPGRAGYGHDHLALVLRAFSHLDGGPNVCARGDARENAFFFGQPACHRKSIIVRHLNALDNLRMAFGIFQVKVLWNKSATEPLDLVWAGLERLAGECLGNDR